MSSLTVHVTDAEVVRFGAVPTIAFRLNVSNRNANQPIQSIALRSQILIEASRRHYHADERNELRDLFGEPDRWSQTVRSLLWTHVSATVPAFSGEVATDLPVPCSFDFNVAAAKYFYAIQNDGVPLCFQFSGTIFYAAADGTLRIDQIGWDTEAKFRLPAKLWRDMMDHYYPNSAWLRLRRDAFDRLYEYKRALGLATWEEAIERLLPLEKEAVL
jgi:Family of unknown function (DUF6084)